MNDLINQFRALFQEYMQYLVEHGNDEHAQELAAQLQVLKAQIEAMQNDPNVVKGSSNGDLNSIWDLYTTARNEQGWDTSSAYELANNVYSAQLQRETNQANIDLQKYINQQNIDFQTSQNELAYQRSTLQAQLQQALDAGMSQQQALRFISGQSAGTYTAATPTLSMPTLQAPGQFSSDGVAQDQQNKLNLANSIVGAIGDTSQIANQFLESLTSSNGGSIGALKANGAMSFVTQHLDDLPISARTYFGLKSYLNSKDAPKVWKDFVQSKEWKQMESSYAGRKSFSEFMNQSYTFANQEAQLDRNWSLAQSAKAQATLDSITLDDDAAIVKYQAISAQLQSQFDVQTTNQKIKNTLVGLKAQFQDETLRLQLISNPEYRRKHLERLLKDEDNANIMAACINAKLNASKEFYDDPNNAYMLGVLELFQNCGFMENDYTAVAAYLVATHNQISGGAQNFLDACKKLASKFKTAFF